MQNINKFNLSSTDGTQIIWSGNPLCEIFVGLQQGEWDWWDERITEDEDWKVCDVFLKAPENRH